MKRSKPVLKTGNYTPRQLQLYFKELHPIVDHWDEVLNSASSGDPILVLTRKVYFLSARLDIPPEKILSSDRYLKHLGTTKKEIGKLKTTVLKRVNRWIAQFSEISRMPGKLIEILES